MTVEPTDQSGAAPAESPAMVEEDPQASSPLVADASPASGSPVDLSIQEILGQQKAERRRSFWLGFVAIAVVGGLWAYLIKEPVNPDFFADLGADPAEPARVEVPDAVFEEVEFETTVVPMTQPTPTVLSTTTLSSPESTEADR